MKLQITQELVDKMNAHGVEVFPFECCGFIFGEDREEGRLVTEVLPANNAKQGDQRRRFEIDPLEYLKAERHALSTDTTLIGIYHSHPNHPAIPSEHDLKQAVPFFSYIILSVEPDGVKDLTSWQLGQEKQFEKEEIQIENRIETLNK